MFYRNFVFVIVFNFVIGYVKVVEIVKIVYKENKFVIDVVEVMIDIFRGELELLLDLKKFIIF